MGFGKLSDLFFGSGHIIGVNSSMILKVIFGYGLLGIVPMIFLAVSIIHEFAISKIAVLFLILLMLIYSAIRKRQR
jgi:hypothetical protein